MSFSLRIFLIYFVFMACAGYFMVNSVLNEIKPAIRQSTEETLVDTANLLAELLRQPLEQGRLGDAEFTDLLTAYGQRNVAATISGVDKKQVNHRIYVTDKNGRVLLDSAGLALNQDYSRWNDVYLTLRGQYGARSSTELFDGQAASVMYVGAPIVSGTGAIIGVVSVSKPSRSVQPFLDKARNRLTLQSALVIGIGLLAGVLFSWWLSAELRRLRNYAQAVSSGQRAQLPKARVVSGELAQLAAALESMRTELDGKAYVERYVQTLAHEIRCPLTAIRAAAELLNSPMSDAQKQRFLDNIEGESVRLQQLLDRLLDLTKLEQKQSVDVEAGIHLQVLWQELYHAEEPRFEKHKVQWLNQCRPDQQVTGDRFLLRQAFANFMDNALDFTPEGGRLEVRVTDTATQHIISLFNTGPAIPEFALERLTERFYSLQRPGTGKKSTGLGLNFVQEVAGLHKGSLYVRNVEGGVEASLCLPHSVF